MKDWLPSPLMNARAICLAGVVGIVLSASQPSELHAETLETLLPYVIENHDRVRASKARLTAARNRAREALGDWYPTLSQTANAGHESQQNAEAANSSTGFHEWDISLTQLLWDFGSTNAAIDKARLQVESARYDLIETRQSLILEAITAYLNVVRSNAALNFAKNSEENIRKQTGLEEALVGLGSGFSTDVLQAKTQLAGAQARRAQSDGARTNALNRYQAVFGRMPDDIAALEKVPFPAPFLPTTLTQATDIAFESNPALKNAILDADIAMEDVRMARADNFTPKIDATAERKFKKNVGGTIGSEQETLAKVEMTFDFNLGFTAINTLRASESDLSATTFTAADTRRNIEEQVRNAWQQLETAKQTASHLNNQANIAAAFLELARNERQLGRRSLIDVLSGETNLINAQSDALSAETDVLIASYGLLAATGLLEYDVIKRSKGIKPPTTELPASAPAAETPMPAPVQPVTPDKSQINGAIEPDVTVASGRSLRQLQEIFKNVEAPDMRILPDTVQTFGRSQSGELVMRPEHPPKPKSRYESFADFDTRAGTFASTDDVPEIEYASIEGDEFNVGAGGLPSDSDTGIASTPIIIGLTDYISAPTNNEIEVAAVPDAASEPVTETLSAADTASAIETQSKFSLQNIFSFIGDAGKALLGERKTTPAPEVKTASVAMDMPPMPLPEPDTAIEVSSAPMPETTSDPISKFLGDVVAFFEKSQPETSMAEEVAAVEERTAAEARPDTVEHAQAATELGSTQLAAIPAAPDMPEPAEIKAENNLNNFGSLVAIFNFFENAHQRAKSDATTNRFEPAAAHAPVKIAKAPENTMHDGAVDNSKPTLLTLISDLFGSEKIEYAPAGDDSFNDIDQH